jgi:hypothetical protein
MSFVKVTGLAAGFAGVCALAVAVESAAHTSAADTADTAADALAMESFIITASAVTSGRTSWRK